MKILGCAVLAIAWIAIIASYVSTMMDYFRPTDDGGKRTKTARFVILNGLLVNRRMKAIEVKE